MRHTNTNGRRCRAFCRQALATGLARGLIGVATSLLVLWYLIAVERDRPSMLVVVLLVAGAMSVIGTLLPPSHGIARFLVWESATIMLIGGLLGLFTVGVPGRRQSDPGERGSR